MKRLKKSLVTVMVTGLLASCAKQNDIVEVEKSGLDIWPTINSEVKKDPSFHFEGLAYTKERCSDLAGVEDTINHCLRMMYYAPQTRKDITEQILMELKII